MAGAKSDYVEASLLGWVKGTTMPAAPAAVYLALFTTPPVEAGTGGTEVSGTGYARTAVTFGSVSQVGGDGSMSNSAPVTFPTAGGSWGTISTTAGLYDASTAGNLLYLVTLSSGPTIATGQTVQIATGGAVVTEG